MSNAYVKAVEGLKLSQSAKNSVLAAVREVELHPAPLVKKKKHILRKVLVAAAIAFGAVLLSISAACAVTGVNYFEEIYRFFDNSISPDVIESVEGAAYTSHDITVTVTDVIADGMYTKVRLDINDMRMKNLRAGFKDIEDDGAREMWDVLTTGVAGVQLYDRFGILYPYESAQSVGSSDNDTVAEVLTFMGSPTSPTSMHLFIRSVNGVDGAWDMEFDVTPQENRQYGCDTVYTFSNGTKVQITDVEMYASRAVVKGEYLNYKADANENFVIDGVEHDDSERNSIFGCSLYAEGKAYEMRQLSTDYNIVELQFEPVYGDFDTLELEIGFGRRLSSDGNNDEPIETQKQTLKLTEK